jgi:hypothetical protein
MVTTQIALKEHSRNCFVELVNKQKENTSSLLEAIDNLNLLLHHQELLNMALDECKSDTRVSLLLDIYLSRSEAYLETVSENLERLRQNLS